ncbi:substrate-binding domain-containing protein [Suttonella sp. R2A3]|nr:substrate-binding domain-containing protein [Suttonella sp. R2A3]UJF24798.1 substrate-binding domain-containing protein [Suttonella sp. R2A3]
MMKKIVLSSAVLALAVSTGAQAQSSRDYISIVGSSTVYPFASLVAEHFGKTSDFKAPKIESTGSGGGLKLFCAGLGPSHPDITNASRAIKQSEIDTCAANGIESITEVKVGYDGIVIANSKDAEQYNLNEQQLYLALGKKVPNPDGSDSLVDNPYQKWSDIDESLPNQNIEVLGPPPSSGTRDAFAELALEGGCDTFEFIKAMEKDDHKAVCHGIREDGAYIEAGENDNLIVNKLVANPAALGIFGYSFLEENTDKVQGSSIDGVAPTFDAIASGEYPLSRPLFFYIKNDHVGVIPGVKEYAEAFLTEDASGSNGYLKQAGLVPLSGDELAEIRAKVEAL